MLGSKSTQSGALAQGPVLPLACPVCDARYPADFKVCPRDAARLESAAANEDPLIGTVLGQSFRIVRAVGEGGSARVYEARHLRLAARRFALKILHGPYASQPTVVQRFQREAEAVAGIDHPNVVSVYDVDRAPDGRPFLVTEFLEGSDLGSLLKQQKRLPVARAARILREVCAALTAAHARGVVHRDLKPENVFLVGAGAEPRVKVLDFGISKVLDSAAEALTRTGMIVGTPGYMSPEQAAGQTVDARTDVYGAGAILYRLVTGRAAFAGRDTTEVLSAVLTEEPTRPRSIEPSIPEALELVIQRAMAKAASQRYQSMQELACALVPFDEALVFSTGGDTETPSVSEVRILGRGSDASITTALTQTTLKASELVRRARPSIVLFSLACYLWFLGCAVDAMTAILATGKPLDEHSATTRVYGAVAAAAVVFLGPLVLWIRHVAKKWSNSHAAIELSATTRRVTFAAIVSYAVVVLALRLLMATTGLSGLDSSVPRVSLALLLVTIAGGTGALLHSRRRSQEGPRS